MGERLITSRSEPVFGGVYKLVATEQDGQLIPKIKLSENVEKVTNPGFKTVWRLFDNQTGMAIADVLTLEDEVIDDSKPYVIFSPEHTYKRKKLTNFTAKKLQVQLFSQGKCVYQLPTLEEIRSYSQEQLATIWDEVKRFENPHAYYVDLSEPLWQLKQQMLDSYFGSASI